MGKKESNPSPKGLKRPKAPPAPPKPPSLRYMKESEDNDDRIKREEKTKMKSLAINGGNKTRTKNFPPQPGPTLTSGYLDAVKDVLDSRVLSGFRGNNSDAFYGGKQVKLLEKEFKEYIGSEYAISCNSATSGLHMACGAIGLQPGDEVIVTPWSMSCSATAPLVFGAIPVFADIEPDYFCLDPDDVERKITDRTKAIIVVDLFGQPYDMRINEIAEKHNLVVIEDACQAIGSTMIVDDVSRMSGTLGNIGVFSFTQGKHITSGEGGMCVTNNPLFGKSLQLLRNHSEAVVKEDNDPDFDFRDLVGFNMRLSEIQAAILRVELEKLDKYVEDRVTNADVIYNNLYANLGMDKDEKRPGATHSYYVQPIFTKNAKKIAEALKAELMPDEVRIDRGVPVNNGYIDPLYLVPLFQARTHWAFGLEENEGHSGVYEKGTCPVAERLTEDGLVISLLHGLDLSSDDLKDVCDAFVKVFSAFEGVE